MPAHRRFCHVNGHSVGLSCLFDRHRGKSNGTSAMCCFAQLSFHSLITCLQTHTSKHQLIPAILCPSSAPAANLLRRDSLGIFYVLSKTPINAAIGTCGSNFKTFFGLLRRFFSNPCIRRLSKNSERCYLTFLLIFESSTPRTMCSVSLQSNVS